MPKRPCLGLPGHTCSRLTDRADHRCSDCAARWNQRRDARRGTKQERGYTAAYDKARERAVANATHCTTCQRPFTADNPATGGHAVAIRKGGTPADGVKAECRRCNYGWRKTGN